MPLYVDDNPDNIAWCAGNAEARVLLVEIDTHGRRACADGHAVAADLRAAPRDGRHAGFGRPDCYRPPHRAPEFRDFTGDTLATICYTSGTSGRPKGVMLSHGNIIANVESCRAVEHDAIRADTFLSILPLSHMFERTGGYYLPLAVGARVAYCRGVAQIADDLAEQRPTRMFAVPRIFEKFQARIEQSLSTSPRQAMARSLNASRAAGASSRAGPACLIGFSCQHLRALVAKPILGAHGRTPATDGASAARRSTRAIARTFIGLGLAMLQGYGMTEASPVISVNLLDDNDPESVGPPLPGIDIRLCALRASCSPRGGNVMQGYWRNDEATRASIDADGWLHTGDIAEIRDGKIYIRGSRQGHPGHVQRREASAAGCRVRTAA